MEKISLNSPKKSCGTGFFLPRTVVADFQLTNNSDSSPSAANFAGLFSEEATGSCALLWHHRLVWPGILAGSGTPPLETTGFELPKQSSRSLQAPTGWSGRFWGRSGCKFNGTGPGSCSTADCGSGQVECNGAGAAPPATLAEFTLGSGSQGSQDFYDVSLVDGYNLPMIVEASGGSSGMCAATGCVMDLNKYCPDELKVSNGDACKSACEAFGKPEYCCSGAHNTPDTCKPSVYAALFKMACPRAYSYAYDDQTSTFTCTGADYTITLCPSIPTSQTAVVNATPTTLLIPPQRLLKAHQSQVLNSQVQ
ncbi:thaumatin-like protein 1 [Heracleum sosnowskyi]|uniref:Thaumatin-like protein 1 n=1 Tax=Heracleum sosnowskyi TaxID=360622 RepID=A0AAD8HT57_9APIA|nr:thaumatin-like protein 1 [Heracleum sosnowskyi]